MSKKKKTVTAPRSFDPGKGRPKEYLAYLNWQEMQALQRLNGEGPYKGPRGIPSFVLGGFGSAGSGTYSSSGQQQKSSTTGARGPTGPRGEARASPAGTAGGGAGSVSRTSGSQEGSRQGGGGSGVGAGTSPSGTRGAGAARTVDSSGRTTGPSGPLSAPARTQPSADTSARQVAATNDASRALQSTSALKSDFQSGGIKQISVGPMGTPVTVGGQIKGAIRGVQKQASYAPVGSAFGPRAGLDRTVGTVSPSQIAADAAMNRLASGSNVLTGYPEKIQERVTPVPTSGPNRGLGTSPAAPSRYAAAAENIYAGANSPFADPGVQSYDPNTYNRIQAPRVESTYGGYGDFTTPADTYNRLGRVVSSAYGVSKVPYSPEAQKTFGESVVGAFESAKNALGLGASIPEPTEQLRVLSPAEQALRRSYAAYESSATLPSYTPKQFGDRLVTTGSVTREYSPEEMDRLNESDSVSRSLRDRYQQTQIYSPDYDGPQGGVQIVEVPEESGISALNRPRGAAATYTQSYDVPSDDVIDVTQEAYERERDYDVRPPVFSGDFSGSPVQGEPSTAPSTAPYAKEQFPVYVSPEIQKEMERINRLNEAGIATQKRAPFFGPALSAADAIRGLVTGNKTAEADAALKRQYMQSSNEQKAALEAKYPNLTKFANDVGVGSQLPESNYRNWAERSGLIGSGARERGGNDGTNIGIAALPANRPAVTPSPGGGTGTSTPSGDRPYIHYQWDLGINIPSPGDPNYNDYQRYLEQRAAARAAYG